MGKRNEGIAGAIADMRKRIESGDQIRDDVFKMTVFDILENMHFRLAAIERESGPSDSFIELDEIPNRLKA